MFVESAVSDGYALAFEFCDHTRDRVNDLSKYYQHPKYDGLKPSFYSDDTHRGLSNARLLLKGDISSLFNPLTYIEQYLEDYRLDPRKGFSKRYQKFLDEMVAENADAITFSRKINRSATSNGSIMGVAVLGFLKNPADVVMAATAQAIATHSVETAIYAQAIALLVNFYLHQDYDEVSVDDFLAEHVNGQLPDFHGKMSRCDMTAKGTYIAVRRLLSFHSISEMVRMAVELGGDTDSVACISTTIATVGPWRNDLPQSLISGVEGGSSQALIDLDEQLWKYYKENL